jgi:hypothetical protein
MKKSLLLSLALVALAACGDDATSPSGDTGVDVGTDGPAPDSCEGVVIAASTGEPCGPTEGCAEGAECAAAEGTDGAVCLQGCRPGVCETVCEAGEACLPFATEPSQGVCARPPEGQRQAYETCSEAVGACASGLQCIVAAAGAEEGVCLPACVDGACAPEAGRDGVCLVTLEPNTPPSRCLPTCSAAGADDECTGGLTCQASGSAFVCAFPR